MNQTQCLFLREYPICQERWIHKLTTHRDVLSTVTVMVFLDTVPQYTCRPSSSYIQDPPAGSNQSSSCQTTLKAWAISVSYLLASLGGESCQFIPYLEERKLVTLNLLSILGGIDAGQMHSERGRQSVGCSAELYKGTVLLWVSEII